MTSNNSTLVESPDFGHNFGLISEYPTYIINFKALVLDGTLCIQVTTILRANF